MEIVWSDKALLNLSQARDYLTEQASELVAQQQINAVLSAVTTLAAFPLIGRIGRVRGTRELVIFRTPFLAAYRVDGESIEILAVIHASRAWPRRLP